LGFLCFFVLRVGCQGFVPVHHTLVAIVLDEVHLGLLAQVLIVEHMHQLRDDLSHDVVRGKVEYSHQFLLVLGVGDDAFECLLGLFPQVVVVFGVVHEVDCK